MNLTTAYMGLDLRTPLVVAASPLSRSVANVQRMEEAGAGAVVMFSLFEEQLRGREPGGYYVSPPAYLALLQEVSRAVTIPVLGSLNGVTDEGWTTIARQMEDAGAAALELNICPFADEMDGDGRAVEDRHIDVLQAVKAEVGIPVAVKLSPFFSSLTHTAHQLDEAGADGLVLFNRFYQPDFDVQRLAFAPSLQLSQPHEARLPLHWIAALFGQLSCSLAGSRGVHSGMEVVKYLLAGADVVMAASALFANGIGFVKTLLEETTRWMAERDVATVDSLRGRMSRKAMGTSAGFDRQQYIATLESLKSPYPA